MVDATQEAALAQLSKELMQFVIDELALRVAADEKFQLSEQVTTLLTTQINDSIHSAMAVDSDAIARRVVALLRQSGQEENWFSDDNDEATEARAEQEHAEESPEWSARAFRNKEQQGEQPSDSGARKGLFSGSGLEMTILRITSSILLLGLVTLGYLYLQQGSDLRAMQAGTKQTIAAQSTDQERIQQAQCDKGRKIQDQLHLLIESQPYKDNCRESMRGRDQNALCVRVKQLSDLTTTPPQCKASGE